MNKISNVKGYNKEPKVLNHTALVMLRELAYDTLETQYEYDSRVPNKDLLEQIKEIKNSDGVVIKGFTNKELITHVKEVMADKQAEDRD